MTSPTLTEADLNDLRSRVIRVERGELPQDAVTAEELAAALEYYRTKYKAAPPTGKNGKPTTIDIPDF